MIDRPLGAPLRNRTISPSAVTSLSPVCAGEATRAVGLVITAFPGSTAAPPVGRIEATAYCSTVLPRGKMPPGRSRHEQNP
ncbi:MAG: hypothetical protein NTY19_23825 [Planctomycetota bacterium]|nr:hypothetical protein [Planctomycetota bacterium]